VKLEERGGRLRIGKKTRWSVFLPSDLPSLRTCNDTLRGPKKIVLMGKASGHILS